MGSALLASSRPMPNLLRICLVLLLIAGSGAAHAQDLDVIPSYRVEGPKAGVFEVFMEQDLLFEVSLPGLDHQASLPIAGTHLTLLAFSGGKLAGPLPLTGSAELLIDPVGMLIVVVPNNLEIPFYLPFSSSLLDGAEVYGQIFDVDLLDPQLTLESSELIVTRLLAPIPEYAGEMEPLGVTARGTSVVTFDSGTSRYLFEHVSPASQVTRYILDLNDPSVQAGTVQIFEETSQVYPSFFGGFSYRVGGHVFSPLSLETFGTHTLLSHNVAGNQVTLVFQDIMPAYNGSGTVTLERTFEYSLAGKSLKVHAFVSGGSPSSSQGFSSFSLGNHVSASKSSTFEEVRINYMDQIGISLLDDKAFVSTFIDLFQSKAQVHNEALFWTTINLALFTEEMFYLPNTAGAVELLDETGWITVSEDVSDCFVRTNAPESKHGDDFSHMVGVAYSKEPNQTGVYTTDYLNVTRMQSWGMDDVLLWKTHWMNAGQNRRATSHSPANPAGGTDAELAQIVQTAVAGGWRVALYTDFYSLDQAEGVDDNSSYSEQAPVYINWDDAVRDFQGNFRVGFGIAIDPSIPHGALYNTRLLAPRRALNHFKREATTMLANYGVNANYFDVMTISSPDLIVTGSGANQGVISGDHRTPSDGTIGGALNSYRHLFQEASKFVDGPSLGEGSFWLKERRWDTFYMGYIDGAWRSLSTGGSPQAPGASGEEQPIMPDYEVNVVRPVMKGLFGMGQYTRFFKPQTHPLPFSDDTCYEYRVTEISYGHNGFMMSNSIALNGGDYLEFASQIKEYYTMRAFADEWNAAGYGHIEYRKASAPGGWMSLSGALKTGLDLTTPVIRMTFPSGLVVVVNHSSVTVNEGGQQIPHNGWSAANPSTGFVNSSILDPLTGGRVDRVVCADFTMVDGNGASIDFGAGIGVHPNLWVNILSPAKVLTEELNGDITVQ